MTNWLQRHGAKLLGLLVAIVGSIGAVSVSAETLMMPPRPMLMGTSEVVWGANTTFPNDGTGGIATTYEFDFNNDGVADASGTVADTSYIAVNVTYVTAGVKTAKLTVTRSGVSESSTVQINVYDASAVTPEVLRGVNVDRAIENGLRYLWQSQVNRDANFPGVNMTNWAGYTRTYTALIVLAFENQGYRLPNDQTAPTGIYERFVVQRGLNYVFDQMRKITINAQTNVNPCVGTGIEAAPCVGLEADADSGQPGYSTAIASLPISGSNAPNRLIDAGIGAANANFVAGKTYKEVLQRTLNAVVLNQSDSGNERGGWSYYVADSASCCNYASDGSVIGWDVLALLDGEAFGGTVPAAVKTEFRDFALIRHLNNDGSFNYTADGNPNADDFVGKNPAKAGIGMQGLYWIGEHGDVNPRVAASRDFLNAWWNGPQAGANYACTSNSTYNKGCGYAMFNVFKALKLHGVATLPNVNRPAGSVGDLHDWYEDYVDYLLANQNTATSTTGGHWPSNVLGFSSIVSDTGAQTALAELILAPVALIAPDETKFATLGLQPLTATRVLNSTHTLTAKAESAGGTGIPGVTITIKILTGPNAPDEKTGQTDGNGELKFTYTGDGGLGQDKAQAFIGSLASNEAKVDWVLEVIACDVNGDKIVDRTDLALIAAGNLKPKNGPNDPRDANGDGVITVSDVRYCQLRLTKVQ